ncbi:MAG: ATP-binding cassette domain-containing protein [Bacilli bacterium]|nr:ATP-binding cassette domain-containing protein [Bacilli bacterium]
MIELKNVQKIYKSKKNFPTTALNNINLKIGNKGMVFIVGKSGSGKSTLLNLLGGLDSPTSGEILVNGRNIEKFNKNDYDSYRNTYIGFIFQEFNVLDLYNVYENIELSLKLQNQEVSRNEIDKLLDNLGIAGLGDRKINELSGGQKQRVAIARALVKKSKIIMADEPTGNLDQKSSEQIFDILKNISKTELVIVVSHDMESAKKYADRIIEVQDGDIISDTKPEEKIENAEFALKKSHLPFSYALKMAFKNFKAKPLKLVMTIILTTISLVFMGLAVTCALFNKTNLTLNTMKENNTYVYDVGNTVLHGDGSLQSLALEKDDLDEIKEITNADLNLVYSLYSGGELLKFEFGEITYGDSIYQNYLENFKFIEINDSRIIESIIGSVPTNSNEILVHKYFADYMIKYGIKDATDKLYFPKNYDEIINSKTELKLEQNKVIITGIIDDDDSLYEEAKKIGHFGDNYELEQYYRDHYCAKGEIIYVKGFTENVILDENIDKILNSSHLSDGTNNGSYISNLTSLKDNITVATKDGIKTINSLEKNQVVIGLLSYIDDNYYDGFNSYSNEIMNSSWDYDYNDFYNNYNVNYLQQNTINPLYFNSYLVNTGKIELEIVGVSTDGNNYVSTNLLDDVKLPKKEIYTVRIYNDDISDLRKAFSKLESNIDNEELEAGTYYNYTFEYAGTVNYIAHIYKFLAKFILIASLVCMLFTFLLFSSFIVISVSYSKKEIGILRALGATGNDVVKIFGYEAILIALIAWIFAIAGWLVSCNFLNTYIFGKNYFIIKGFVVSPLTPIVMLIFTFFIALLVTSASVSKISKVKPIDAILNK